VSDLKLDWMNINSMAPFTFLGEELNTVSGLDIIRHSQQYFEEFAQPRAFRTSDWLKRGVLLFRMSSYGAAGDAFQEAINISPDSYEAWLGSSLSYVFSGDTESGLSSISQAVSLRPNDSHLLYFHSFLLHILEDYETALQKINRSIELSETLPEQERRNHLLKSYFLRSEILFFLDRYEIAIDDLKAIIEFSPTTLSYARRAYAYNILGRYRLAIEDAVEVIKLDPKDLIGYAALLYILDSSGEEYQTLVEVVYEQLGKLENPSSLGIFLALSGNYDEALDVLNQPSDSQPNNALVHAFISLIHLSSDNYSEAIEFADLALSLDPNNKMIQFFAFTSRGFSYSLQQNYDQAISDLTIAITLADSLGLEHEDAYILRGFSYLGKEQYSNAKADAEIALQSAPENVLGHAVIGVAQSQLGEYESAINNANYVLEKAPEVPFALVLAHLARVYSLAMIGDSENAWLALDEITKLNSDFLSTADGHYLSGIIYHRSGEYENATESYSKALELAPNRVDILTNLGLAMYEVENYSGAVQALQAAVDSLNLAELPTDSPKASQAFLALSVVTHAQQDGMVRLELVQSAIEYSPEIFDLKYLENQTMWGRVLLEDTQVFLEIPDVRNIVETAAQ
jgi:tetratricopeptide (TPR) repeat protein